MVYALDGLMAEEFAIVEGTDETAAHARLSTGDGLSLAAWKNQEYRDREGG